MDPAALFQLLTEIWMLPFPKAIISINGEFPKHDYSWHQILNDVFIFTSGSPPFHHKLCNSSVIAIMDVNSVNNKEILFDFSSEVKLSSLNADSLALGPVYTVRKIVSLRA